MYRAHWPRIGPLIAMLVGAATAMAGSRLTKPQILSAANLMALMADPFYLAPVLFPKKSCCMSKPAMRPKP